MCARKLVGDAEEGTFGAIWATGPGLYDRVQGWSSPPELHRMTAAWDEFLHADVACKQQGEISLDRVWFCPAIGSDSRALADEAERRQDARSSLCVTRTRAVAHATASQRPSSRKGPARRVGVHR